MMSFSNLWKEKPMDAIVTVPNIITGLGFLMVGLYVFGFVVGDRWLLVWSLVFSGVSDLLDGHFARKLGQHTTLGKKLDPLRDRFLLFAVLGNLCFVSPEKDVIFLALAVFWVELFTLVYNHLMGTEVHMIGKLRQAGHLILMGLFVLNYYFPVFLPFGLPVWATLFLMLTMTYVASSFYIIKGSLSE